MPIPRVREEVPPPLPPPRYIGEDLGEGQDPGWQWGHQNSRIDNNFGGNRQAAVKPGSSLFGGASAGQMHQVHPRDRPTDSAFHRRESSTSRSLDDMSSEHDPSDEDRGGKPRPSLANHR